MTFNAFFSLNNFSSIIPFSTINASKEEISRSINHFITNRTEMFNNLKRVMNL